MISSLETRDAGSLKSVFASIVEPMEQHTGEIYPFVEWLQHRAPIRNVLEIGVRKGGTSALWHQISTGRVIGVDRQGHDSLQLSDMLSLAESMQDRYPRYSFLLGDSHDPDTHSNICDSIDLVDLLFLDGDHSYDGVKQDYEMYRGLVRRRGVIAFHDIVDTPLIRSAVHGVYRFWQELPGDKHEFCIGGDWGGIGAIIV